MSEGKQSSLQSPSLSEKALAAFKRQQSQPDSHQQDHQDSHLRNVGSFCLALSVYCGDLNKWTSL